MAALLAACMVMLPNAPRLVAFENEEPPNSVANPAGTVAKAVPVTLRTGIDSPGPVQNGVAVPAVYRPRNSGVGSNEANFKPVNIRQSFSAKQLSRKTLALQKAARKEKEEAQAPVIALRAAAMPIAPAPEFLFVMQTANFDPQGSVVVSFTVWKVTFAAPNVNQLNLNQVRQRFLGKST